jgi:hypothetical protein
VLLLVSCVSIYWYDDIFVSFEGLPAGCYLKIGYGCGCSEG